MNPTEIPSDGHVSIALEGGEGSVILSAKSILADLFARLQPKGKCATPVPRIGCEMDGGHNAGVCADKDASHDYRLILGPELEPGSFSSIEAQIENLNTGAINGGWRLPTLREQSILRGQMPDFFEKVRYWAADAVAGNPDFAWYTDFGNGSQYCYRKRSTCRARPVRSSSI